MAFGKFGKYYPGGVQLKPESLDLVAVLRQEFESFREESAQGRRLEFECEFESLPARTDRQHLKYILVNLLQNAVKYSKEGGEVRVSLARREGRAVLEVADQGIGIPQEELDELFSPFFRATNVGDIQGTGMGLAIVKKSAKLIEAAVEVESGAGEGTRFRVSLPTSV